jgi:hypothetical protein
MMIAPTGFMLSTIGSSIASAPAGPMPGSTPITVPRMAPMKANSRFWGCSAVSNPPISSGSTSPMADS